MRRAVADRVRPRSRNGAGGCRGNPMGIRLAPHVNRLGRNSRTCRDDRNAAGVLVGDECRAVLRHGHAAGAEPTLIARSIAILLGRMTETVPSFGLVTNTEPSAPTASPCSPGETAMTLAILSPDPGRTPISDLPEPPLCTTYMVPSGAHATEDGKLPVWIVPQRRVGGAARSFEFYRRIRKPLSLNRWLGIAEGQLAIA